MIIGIAVGAGALLAIAAFLALVALRLKRRAEEERKKNPFGKAFVLVFKHLKKYSKSLFCHEVQVSFAFM